MQTVLGLSMTSTSVGWVLLDHQGPDDFTLDHDAFDVRSGADGATRDMTQHAAAARGAQAIAAASGHKVGAVRVTWSEDVEADGAALLTSLADVGFDNVLTIPLNQATQTWAIEVGRASKQRNTALCILEPGTATVMVVDTGAGTVRTAVTNTREHAADLIDWLITIFKRDGWLPESLHLVGARDDLDAVMGPIGDALPIPVSDSVDAQLALARGAALATVTPVAAHPSEAAETPRNDPPPRRDRPWLVTHAKKLTISTAAVAVVGAALSLAAGSALNVEKTSAQAANPAGASVTSASVHTVPAPASAPQIPQVQPLAVAPPPAPPAPPETPTLPAEPVAAVVPEPEAVSIPVPEQRVSAAPAAAPAAPIALPPAAPLAAPAPTAPPPAPVVPPGPADPPPPPDPLQVVLSPLFGGLP